MSLTVKVFYERANGSTEIRRFPLNTSEVDCYQATKDKIRQLYSSLTDGNFTLYWQDPDGDRVAFSTNEEMKDAIAYVKDAVLRVYIPESMEQGDTTPQSGGQSKASEDQKQSEAQGQRKTEGQSQDKKREKPQMRRGPIHIGVTCDGCEGPVIGVRFKCCVCPDYDLCQACEGKGMHTEHDMFKITKPRVNPMNFLPAHLGRYIHRCMRNMAHGQSTPEEDKEDEKEDEKDESQAGAGAEEKPEDKEKKEKEKSAYDEYLNNVGANIAAFLDPFGIDVTYDIHHGNGGHQSGGCRGGWGRGGCRGGWGRGSGCHAWENMHQKSQEDGTAEGQAQTEGKEKEMETDATDNTHKKTEQGNHDIPMENENNKAGSDNSSEEWTYVQEDGSEVRVPGSTPIPMPGPSAIPMPGPVPTQSSTVPTQSSTVPTQSSSGPTPPPRPSTGPAACSLPPGNLYPNLRIQQALDQMLAMGFSNTDGWLSTLLIEHDGDIGVTLDAIKAKATQQLENLRGGH